MARSKTPFALPIPLLDFDRSFGPQRLRIFQQFARMARSKTPLPCPSHFWILIGLLAPDASEFSAFERLKRSRRHFLPGHAPFCQSSGILGATAIFRRVCFKPKKRPLLLVSWQQTTHPDTLLSTQSLLQMLAGKKWLGGGRGGGGNR